MLVKAEIHGSWGPVLPPYDSSTGSLSRRGVRDVDVILCGLCVVISFVVLIYGLVIQLLKKVQHKKT